ncbi:MAG TPA: sigma-70 family RNA polymerase sigma factor [Flavobacteriales bacterium]|nr:sigma-70 family RNA polymerase sigma factor [Flavobacteriales bacterium]HNM69526.1 sigma-70 family RNA polymerase sigma factor [Flavobacteriales bacterium]
MFLRRKTIEPLSDEDLVERVRSGQRTSLAALWDRYAHLLFGVGMKYLKDTEGAKDLVVEVFASLPELLGKHEVRSFRPWIHTVMRNRCLMLLRKDDPERRVDGSLLGAPDEMNDDAVLHEATLQRLEAAVGELKDAQRTCIRLFYLERNSYQQTAERTGFSVEQVRSHIQNGRRNLRLILERDDDQSNR